jgi:hypothetical protein
MMEGKHIFRTFLMTKDLTSSQDSTMAQPLETAVYCFTLETIKVKYMEMK